MARMVVVYDGFDPDEQRRIAESASDILARM
jgi:hypothetical protein